MIGGTLLHGEELGIVCGAAGQCHLVQEGNDALLD